MTTRRSKVLIADDNEQNVELLQAYLSDVDCEVQTALDGEQTLSRVREDPPDLILLDIMMPKISGYEVCRKLKSHDATRDIQILMITALNQVGDIERAVQAGTDDFLIKPVNKLELVVRVKSLLRVRRLQNELERALEYLKDVEEGGRDPKPPQKDDGDGGDPNTPPKNDEDDRPKPKPSP